MAVDLSTLVEAVQEASDVRLTGAVSRVVGLTIESTGPAVRVGDLVEVHRPPAEPLVAEVVGFRERSAILVPLGSAEGVAPGSLVVSRRRPLRVTVGKALLSRVLDGLGRPADGRGPVPAESSYPVDRPAPDPLRRPRISQALSVGVRAIDGLLTCAKGQRIGIFAGSGVGKSTLLGMMARGTSADVVVVALVGERGREVRDFIERDLEGAMDRAVVVAATSDQPAMVRVKAAFVATAIAEFFRDQGLDVLLMMDSLTRFSYAQREIGLAAGEPPATRGYPPSVFALLPRLLERAGTAERGSITGFYTVLVDGDDLNEPIADASRAILDGHVVLSRSIAERQHYPAIDVLASISRLMAEVAEPSHKEAAARVRRLLAAYRDVEDLVHIGAYVRGSNPVADRALDARPAIDRFLQQGVFERSSFRETVQALADLAAWYGVEP
ncbi:FliI/YscN family ATPase [Carboxydochorda subterranea]|uniref:FliI/YscN family ATPase n=1 Tax=Carboxydichorda subterranea TaxID=3109565 RepID=A0ABZ1C0H6_9FIRM|nr:FliI/YscN family ATPase [Limnochorda sp. L945t]WRP18449.1 FliI/YscN family ATPase [Limnochorda sp. L945t]